MPVRDRFRPPRVVLALFFALVAGCALVLGWLAYQVFEQDRAVEAQRLRERQEAVAAHVVAALDRALLGAEATAALSARGVKTSPSHAFAHVPLPEMPSPHLFAEAEELEFVQRDLERAAAAYARLAQLNQPGAAAEALVRLGRVQRKLRRWEPARSTYAALAKLDAEPVAGMPAGLVARAALCSVAEESGERAALERMARELWRQLTSGRWAVSQSTLDTYLAELRRWVPGLALPEDWSERLLRSRALELAVGAGTDSGHAEPVLDGTPFTVRWNRVNGVLQVRMSGPSFWRTLWRKLEAESGIALRVESPAGEILYGAKTAAAAAVYRPAGLTGLPWSLTVSPAIQAAPPEAALARRRLLLAGLMVFAILLAAGTWLIAGAISKELAVARLQSDFVSAVSHEFRTPLTALRQLSELLARGRVSDESARQRAYEVMQGESDRLARLVESLLDFGRMQSGAFKYRFETLDAGQWAGRVVDDFRLSPRGRGRPIHFRSHGIESAIRADREALSGALWNLLDNAVKYSPEGRPVEVDLQSRDGKVELSVRDQGIGIAEHDLKHVFDKFYRGEAAKSNGTKGTGIGLALTREIVRAHGGTVRAASAAGKGSEFTLVLPGQES